MIAPLRWQKDSIDMFLKNYKNIDYAKFSNVEIEINTNCNRKCSYCPNSKFSRGKHVMEFSLYTKILKNLSNMGFNGVFSPHFYGEPLLNPHLDEYLIIARKLFRNTVIRVFTNGDLLDTKRIQRLFDIGINQMIITAHDPDAYNVANTLLDTLNSNVRKSILLITSANTLIMNRGGLVNVPAHKAQVCNYAWSYLTIDYKGNVLLCCNDYFGKNIFGNLRSESIESVWHKEEYLSLRKELSMGVSSLPICTTCLDMKKVDSPSG